MIKKLSPHKRFPSQFLTFTLSYTLMVVLTLIWRNYPIQGGVSLLDRIAFFGVMSIGAAMWFVVIRSIYSWQSQVLQKHHKLTEQVGELGRLNEALNQRISKHNDEFTSANQDLISEIERRQQVEEESKAHAAELEKVNKELMDAKRAVLNILEDLEREKKDRQLILDSSGEGICGIDLEGDVVFMNPAAVKMLGYTEERELTGRFWHDVIHPTHVSDSDCPHHRTFSDDEIHQVTDEVFTRKDGVSFHAEYISTPIRENGEKVGTVISFNDITERQQLELQLLQAQKMEAVGQLAGGVAHDFNNALMVIDGYVLLREQKLPPDDPAHKDFAEIKKAVQRAKNLTDQLLAFSRRQIIEPKVINLNDLVLELSKMLRHLLGEDIELVILPSSGLGLVKVDPGQMQQVLMNLAVNARDAMPDGGKLTIETSNTFFDQSYAQAHGVKVSPGEYVMLSVTDSGMGMSKEVQEKIFEPFFTTKAKGKGTGLGMATSYGIIKQSNGFIWVYSELDEGSSFKVYLPQVHEAEDVIEETEEKVEIPKGICSLGICPRIDPP